MKGCFDNQLPAHVFDGVKTSRMLSCQAVTIGRDMRGVASLAWGWVCGTGGDWSVIDYATQTPSHATALATTYVSIVIPSNTVWTAGFVLFLELFILISNRPNRPINRPIIGRLFGTDYRPTDNRCKSPVRYRCIPNSFACNWWCSCYKTSETTDIPVLGLSSCERSVTSLLSASVWFSSELTPTYTQQTSLLHNSSS